MTTDLRARAESALAVPLVHNIVGPLIRDLVAALPPDPAPTGERRPCADWHEVDTTPPHYMLNVVGVKARVYSDGAVWRWYVVGCATSPSDGRARPTLEAAQLAAEDAAAELLRAGLRALGVK